MDVSIASLSTLANRIQLTNDIGVAVLDMSLDSIDTLGEGMKQMMELSVNPDLGSNIDISV